MAANIASGFLKAVGRTPSAPALLVDGRTYSYAELCERALRVAGAIERADPSGAPVGVLAHRSIEAYAGVLGAALAARTYVPLNPHFPVARLKAMAESARIGSLVADEAGRALGLELAPPLELTGEPAPTPRDPEPGSIAYLLFTSGSTGRPKGVGVTHENVRAYLDVQGAHYALGPDDRTSQAFDLTFDLSVHDLFVTWDAGACLCVVPHKSVMAPAKFMRDAAITAWFSVPSVAMFMERLRMLKPGALPALRWSLFCGEALPDRLCARWAEAAPNSKIENLYGPTEATIAITRYLWDQDASPARAHHGVVPIGRAIGTQRTAVVDASMRPVERGEPGQLVLGGSQVTPGYWRDPERSARAFIESEAIGPGRWYLTGDLAREEPDGCLIYLGRVDHQVQVRGHRVELQEIDAALREASGGALGAAVAWPVEAQSAQGIVGFLPREQEPRAKGVLDALGERLPFYMQPSELIFLDEFPLNANGKIDRGALTDLLKERGAAARGAR